METGDEGMWRREITDIVFAREEVGNGERKRIREILSDCVFDIQERREEMNGFSSVRSKHNGGEDGRWRLWCRKYRASMEMKVTKRCTYHQWRRMRRRNVLMEGVELVREKCFWKEHVQHRICDSQSVGLFLVKWVGLIIENRPHYGLFKEITPN